MGVFYFFLYFLKMSDPLSKEVGNQAPVKKNWRAEEDEKKIEKNSKKGVDAFQQEAVKVTNPLDVGEIKVDTSAKEDDLFKKKQKEVEDDLVEKFAKSGLNEKRDTAGDLFNDNVKEDEVDETNIDDL